jgi:hypothetical protein
MDFDVNLTDAEQAGGVRFKVVGAFSHFRRVGKHQITQQAEGTLVGM